MTPVVSMARLRWFSSESGALLRYSPALGSLVSALSLGSRILRTLTSPFLVLFRIMQGKGMRDHESFDRLVSASNPALQTVSFASRIRWISSAIASKMTRIG
jgi:hypothetical protein